MKTSLAVVLPWALLLAAACASSAPSDNPSKAGKGFRTLEATVVDRAFVPSGGSRTGLAGSDAWFLDFEARDGEATVHYHFPVSRDQYNRYHEGDRVEIVLSDNELREIRPAR